MPRHAFFEQTVLEGQVGHDLLQGGGLPTQVFHLVRGGGARRISGEPLLAGFEEVLRPAIVHRRRDAFPAAQLRDALFTPQAFQHDTDLLLGRELSARRTPNVLHDRFSRSLHRPGFLLHLRS